MNQPTKLLIIDDHELIRGGLIHLLVEKENKKNFSIIESNNIEDAKRRISIQKPQIILMDYKFKDGTGDELVLWLRKHNLLIPSIVLANHSERFYIEKMRESGARGYLLKSSSNSELLTAINIVLNGGDYFPLLQRKNERLYCCSPDLGAQNKITSREREVLLLMMDKLSTEQISEKLFISRRTVETHKQHLLKKFDVKNSVSLIRTVSLNGI